MTYYSDSECLIREHRTALIHKMQCHRLSCTESEKIMVMTGCNFRTYSTSILIADDAQTRMIGNIVFVLMVDTRVLSIVRRPISKTSKNDEDECKMVRYKFLEVEA